MNEFITIVGSMIVSMLMGALFTLLIGSKTTLLYLRVKVSRGKKVLIFLKTPFGWIPKLAGKKENTLYWKHDKAKYITTVEDEGSLTRYGRVDSTYINLKFPTVALKLGKGQLYPDDFDPQTYNNLLVRAATKPSITDDNIKKLVQVALILLVVLAIGLMATYGKIGAIQKAIVALNTIAPAVV